MVNLNGKAAIVTGDASGLRKAKAEVLAADGAAVVDVDEVRAGVVDPVFETQLPHAVQLLVARCGRDHGRAGPFGQLDRGFPTPSALAWISAVWPASRFPAVNRRSSAVPNATGTHTAAVSSSPSGIGPVDIAGMTRYEASEPVAFRVTTRSPTAGPQRQRRPRQSCPPRGSR
jgi:hypothetical protein